MAQESVVNPETESKANAAPYLAFRTFQSAIEALEQGVPKKIDRTIWRSQSGIVQSQILMALRFFGLVDDQDRPTQLLHEYVESKDTRKQLMAMMLNVAFAEIIAHDLTKMTPKMLDDAIDGYHVSGETKRKAVTFFLKAAKFAEMPMHPLLSAQVRNTGPRKKRSRKLTTTEFPAAETPASPNGESIKTIQLRNGGTVALRISADPFSLDAEDRKFVFDLVDRLQEYANNHESIEEEDEEE